ncbi:endonuclease III domain-containing protein [Methanoculleus sp. FWC-SCC1]|uniref:Endonuclease III domain-containing protein n=2 Tax=Methanoculleus frigidifontis TaxID=2584085 RepID=A0ABT8MDG6_9EURY|nr:endonuclease III domain-containing protein [Methanoculleus sp. FWC-SCC1]
MHIIERIYHELYRAYGPQGWWPLLGYDGVQPTKSGSVAGYHPLRYDLPETRGQVFEICVGAILTQNTNWLNVEQALLRLHAAGGLDAERLCGLGDAALKEAIRPAGYYNQKARKLREFADFFLSLESRAPDREELLELWGVGRETADSMLLYAFHRPVFVVDAYTRRIFGGLGLVDEGADYDTIRLFIEEHLAADLPVYQEYHALLVEHAKRYYRKRANRPVCPLRRLMQG